MICSTGEGILFRAQAQRKGFLGEQGRNADRFFSDVRLGIFSESDQSIQLVLPRMLRPRAISPAYSRSPPTGTPRAMTLIFTGRSFMRLLIENAVGAPSMVGLTARITSLTSLPLDNRLSSDSIFRSPGPTPLIGEITPPNTW